MLACNEPSKTSDVCGAWFIGEDDFTWRLWTDHDVEDLEKYDYDARRLGPNFQTRYWCGFCEEVVELVTKGKEGCEERQRHISKHIKGKNSPKFNYRDWVPAIFEEVGCQIIHIE
jgi:hypothetical protein